MSQPAPGWYGDPAGGDGQRWWDGTRWTGNVRSAPAAPVVADGPATPVAGSPFGDRPYASGPYAPTGHGPAGGTPYGPAGGSPYGPGGGTPYGPGGQGPSTPGGHGFGGYGQPATPAPPSFARRNGYSLATVAVAAIYLLLAVTVHIVFIGILPIVFGVRALNRREPLGVAALVLGVAVAVFAIYELVRV